MRWILLIIPAFFMTACCCTASQDPIEYQQVVVSPCYKTVSIVDEAPVDVTVTTVSYY